MPEVVSGINKDFAASNNLPLFHVHTTWEYFQSGHYAKGGDAPCYQPESPHPVIVDLLTPDFNDSDTIKHMLVSLAESISKRAGIPRNRIFINHRAAHSEMVFDDGDIVKW